MLDLKTDYANTAENVSNEYSSQNGYSILYPLLHLRWKIFVFLWPTLSSTN